MSKRDWIGTVFVACLVTLAGLAAVYWVAPVAGLLGVVAVGCLVLLILDVRRNRTRDPNAFHVLAAEYGGTYGNQTHMRDVTELVRSKVKRGRLVMHASNEDLGGDPWPGVRKVLVIQYRHGGKGRPAVMFPEDDTVILPLDEPDMNALLRDEHEKAKQRSKERAEEAAKVEARIELLKGVHMQGVDLLQHGAVTEQTIGSWQTAALNHLNKSERWSVLHAPPVHSQEEEPDEQKRRLEDLVQGVRDIISQEEIRLYGLREPPKIN